MKNLLLTANVAMIREFFFSFFLATNVRETNFFLKLCSLSIKTIPGKIESNR